MLHQIYTHLNNVFELLSKAVVESKQKVNIPKLSKEEPEEKEESEKAKREEERGAGLLIRQRDPHIQDMKCSSTEKDYSVTYC